jgi:DNA modification methylase
MARLTIEIDDALYARMKADCEASGVAIKKVVKNLISQRFPYTSTQRKNIPWANPNATYEKNRRRANKRSLDPEYKKQINAQYQKRSKEIEQEVVRGLLLTKLRWKA